MAENGQLAEEYHPQRTPAPSPLRGVDNSSIFKVNFKLLPIKLFYFVFMAAVGVLLPFIALYMMHLGLSAQEIGIIYGTMPFVGFFIRPMIGAVADMFKKHKLTLMVVTSLTGVFYFLLILVPRRSPTTRVELPTVFKCNIQDSFIYDCFDPVKSPSCEDGLTSYASIVHFGRLNNSRSCNFSCSLHEAEFRACFTDDSGSYNQNSCNGTLSRGKHLNFTVPDLAELIYRNTSDDKVGSERCLTYDLKNIKFENSVIHRAFQILCDRETELNCTVHCPQNNNCSKDASKFDKTFYLFFFIFLLANITFAPIFPILDATAYDTLGEKHNHWGWQRAWGTLGFAVFAVTIMIVKQGQIEDYSIFFYIFLPLCSLSTVIGFFLPISSDIKCGQFVRNVFKLLSHAEVSTFLFVVMYFGMLTGALETFLFVYIFDIGGDSLVVAVILLVSCCSELPMLFVSGMIIKKFGLVNCLYLTLVCYAVRFLVFSLVKDPWLVLLSEPLYGICFGLMYAAASSYASIIAPPGMSATIQGLLGGVHFGFGKGIGSLITGFMVDSIRYRWTWGVYGLSSVAILFIYLLLNKLVFTGNHGMPSAAAKGEDPLPEDKTRQKENLIKDKIEGVDT